MGYWASRITSYGFASGLASIRACCSRSFARSLKSGPTKTIYFKRFCYRSGCRCRTFGTIPSRPHGYIGSRSIRRWHGNGPKRNGGEGSVPFRFPRLPHRVTHRRKRSEMIVSSISFTPRSARCRRRSGPWSFCTWKVSRIARLLTLWAFRKATSASV